MTGSEQKPSKRPALDPAEANSAINIGCEVENFSFNDVSLFPLKKENQLLITDAKDRRVPSRVNVFEFY